MNSPLKWTGGKRWQVPLIEERLGFVAQELAMGARRWVEPFCGGASVALGLTPKHALLNDANQHLVNFWHTVQDGVPFETDHPDLNPICYYALRDEFNALSESCRLERALLFYALNHWCFNGIWRVNAAGKFNVPARGRLRPLPPFEVTPYAQAMTGWTFSCGDYGELDLEPGDAVYADPPYDDGFTGYTDIGFDWSAQETLARWLAYHPGPVILTNKATPRIQELYHGLGFRLELIDAPQRMHQSRGRGGTILEVLATRNL